LSLSNNKARSTMEGVPGKDVVSVLVIGLHSGAGKSTICLCLLSSLLKRGFAPHRLAYFKPATQCIDVQLVSKFCQSKGIPHHGVGPIVFKSGFTKSVIDGKISVDSLRQEVLQTYQTIISHNADDKKEIEQPIPKVRKVVVIDGVGYPSVGSVAGVSSAELGRLLGVSSVLIVGKPGIGDAIDSFNLAYCYLRCHSLDVLGVIFNLIPPPSDGFAHTYEDCKKYVTKYFQQPTSKYASPIQVYGFLPQLGKQSSDQTNQVCKLHQPAPQDLEMTENDQHQIASLIGAFEEHVDVDKLLECWLSIPRKNEILSF